MRILLLLSKLEKKNKKIIHPVRNYNLRIARKQNPTYIPIPTHSLPPIIDLRNKFPSIFDQGDLGSCTANALCGIVDYNLHNFLGSRLFLYYNERKLENHIFEDTGAFLHDGITCLEKYGICPETEWPYDVTKFAITPPDTCYQSALKNKAIDVTHIVNDMNSMKTSLANGYPFVVGITIYSSFETLYVAKTGLVPMPTRNDTVLGGHAVICVGYNDSKQLWIMRNSWGTDWGDSGYFYLPYIYLLDNSLSTDLWNIKKMI